MKKKIIIIGNSNKFKKIFKSIYLNSKIVVYPWRKICLLLKKPNDLNKMADIILISGYDYQSQWYSFDKYYWSNITQPLKLVNLLIRKKTKIFYIDTIGSITKKNKFSKNFTFSRYHFAKKELAYKLYRKFKSLTILETPVIIKSNKAQIYGGLFTKLLFNILVYYKLINTINYENIKKIILTNNSNSKNKFIPKKIKLIVTIAAK